MLAAPHPVRDPRRLARGKAQTQELEEHSHAAATVTVD
jgi:hypothetical protein